MSALDMDNWEPNQAEDPEIIDFRYIGTVPRGYKECNKRKYEEMEELQQQFEEDQQGPSEMDTDSAPKAKKLKFTPSSLQAAPKRNIVGLTLMKLPGKKAITNQRSATAWEKKLEKAARLKAFRKSKQEAVSAYKDRMKEKARLKEEAKKRKEENRLKSTIMTPVTNPNTLKKIMKNPKERKKLITM